MAQKKFHIKDDGTIEQCGRFTRCPGKEHWESARSAEIFLDNIAYKAEVSAKVTSFNRVKNDMGHPEHFTAHFSESGRDSARRFRESIDYYVAQNGTLPTYLGGMLRYRLKHWQWRNEVFFDIRTFPEIEPVHGRISRQWVVRVITHDGQHYNPSARDTTVHEVNLDFYDHRNFDANLAELKKAYEVALKATGTHRLDDYSEFNDLMVERFGNMFDAIETVARGEWGLWYELGRGDFKGSKDDCVSVKVNYDGSVFTGPGFTNFIGQYRKYMSSGPEIAIRVADEVEGHPRASWSLSLRDGSWYVEEVTFEGSRIVTLMTDAEHIRSHVYWHVIREINVDKQDIALKKADYAAAVYMAVEDARQNLGR